MSDKPYMKKGTCVRVAAWGYWNSRRYGTVEDCYRSDEWRIVVAFPDGTRGTYGTEDVTEVSPLDPLDEL